MTKEEMARDSEPDFIESLQGFASMCDSGAIDKHDGPMLARKFRDAAFVVSMQRAALARAEADANAARAALAEHDKGVAQ